MTRKEKAIQTREQNPQFTNPLKGSASAYLRQHAHNPVYWEPWGKTALARAKAEDRPILVSIGYASCYWCHVMEREVFENPSIAAVMNKHFVNIKIDREEHPALDEVYMIARQLVTRQGGWPNHVWLTPDLKPFFAGGTFGASEAYGRPGFAQVLESIHESWVNQREAIEAQGEELLRATRHFLERERRGEEMPDIEALSHRLAEQLMAHTDASAGGFHDSPKFPHESYLLFLLAYAKKHQNAKTLEVVMQALYAMAAGGLYDHVGGGFHRYAVDKNWQVPHFEKMIYNQAQLARLYTEFAEHTENLHARHVALSVLDGARAVFCSPEGGFYSAIDAENDGVEGAYYVWTKAELETLLTPEQMAFVTEYYFLAEIPHYPGHKAPVGKVLNARKPLPVAAAEREQNYLELAGLSAQVMNILIAARNLRVPPILDDKILVGGSGLMITAFARAYAVFGRGEDYETAARGARFLLEKACIPEGKLAHMIALGKAHHAAGLEDYAYFTESLLALHSADKNEEWLQAASALMDEAHEVLWDKAGGGYFAAAESAELLVRPRHAEDSALPSPNAVMLRNLYALGWRTGEGRFAERAKNLALAFAPALAINTADIALPEYSSFIEALMQGEGIPQGTGSEAVALSLSLSPADAKTGEECELRLHVRIQEGWHLNAHEPGLEYLVPTVAKIDGAGIGSVQRIEYPAPVKRKFREGEVLEVYEGEISITAFVTLALTPQGNRKQIRVRLACQPCREGVCLPPVGIDATI